MGCPLFLISFGDCLWSLLLFFNIFVDVYITSQTIFWVCVSYAIQNIKFQSAYLVHCELYPTSDNFFKVYGLTQIFLSYGPHIVAHFTDLHYGPVWSPTSNNNFHILNTLTHILIYFFIHTYFIKFQKTLNNNSQIHLPNEP